MTAMERLPGAGPVFERSWKLYRERLVSLLGAAALGAGAGMIGFLAALFAAFLLGLVWPGQRVFFWITGGFVGVSLLLWFVGWAQAAVAEALLLSASGAGVLELYRKTAWKAMGFSWTCLLILLVVGGWVWPFFLSGGLAAAAMTAAPFLWLYLMVALFPAPFVYLGEGSGPWEALGRSLDLTRGVWWRVAGLAALAWMAALVPGFIPFPAGFILGSLASFFPFVVLSVVYQELRKSAPPAAAVSRFSALILWASAAGFALTVFLFWRALPEAEAAFLLMKERWLSGEFRKMPLGGGAMP